MSPTFSLITENIIHELDVIEKKFVVDKQFLHNDFYAKHNTKKKNSFFKNLLDVRKDIQTKYYEFVDQYKVHTFFLLV